MGVYLESAEIDAANKYMSAVHKILNNDPTVKFSVCESCRGTGITAKKGQQWWDGMFCEKCKGYSIKIEKSGMYTLCSNCGGKGRVGAAHTFCPKCNGYGYLDWLENITGIRNKP